MIRLISRGRPRGARCAFTLVELLIVIGIVAALIGLLLPALGAARRASQRANCLSNMRNMQVAHWMYITDNRGYLIQAGLSHGGHALDEGTAWLNTLSAYYGKPLIHRCPADNSPHWPGGAPLPGTTDRFRRTSYGINNFLDHHLVPWGGPYVKINQVRRPAATVHFIEMAETGEFAGADHPHVENWMPGGNPAAPSILAAAQLQTNRHGQTSKTRTYDAVANYGFLDGHAETLTFGEVFRSYTQNRFDPQVAQ